MVEIGDLTQIVTLQSVTRTADGGGGVSEAWGTFAEDATVYAYVTPLRGSEGARDGGVNASGLWLFSIRNRSDVTEQDRILWNGEAYNIRRVMRQGERELYLNIEAERGVAQ